MAYDLFHVFKRLGLVPSNVILVGAWEGGEVKGFLEAGVQMTYLFEAEPTAIRKLKQNYGSDSRVIIFEGAVASEAGKSKTFHVLNHGSSSLLAPDLNHLKKILPDFQIENKIQVQTITLDSSLRNHWGQWNKNMLETLVILDIQGGELEAIKGAPELLEKVGWIQAEVSTAELYQDQNTLAQLDEYLKGKGFNRVSIRIYPERNHGDALYFRTDLISKSFLTSLKIEDFHWNLARKRPTWIPSLSQTKLGRFILKLIYSTK
jgi:FkbM family methyltransferase